MDQKIDASCVNEPLTNYIITKDGSKEAFQEKEALESKASIEIHSSASYIWVRFGCLCCSYLTMYSTFYAMESLQSSINPHSGLGSISVAVISIVVTLGFVFASMILKLCAPKICLFAGIIGVLIYSLLNLYPAFSTLLIGSIIEGFPIGAHFLACNFVIISLSKKYCLLTRESFSSTVHKFNAIFQACYALSKPLGLTITSLVLKDVKQHDAYFSNHSLNILNKTMNFNICGVYHCPFMADHIEALLLPDKTQLYTMVFCLAAVCLVGIIMVCFIPSVPYNTQGKIKQEVIGLFKIHIDIRVLLIIPCFAAHGAVQGMLSSSFYSSFVSCNLGLGLVSPVIICEGLSSALFAALSIFSSRSFDGYIHFALSYIINVFVIILCLIFNSPLAWVMFITVAIHGATLGINKAIFVPLVVNDFQGKEAFLISLFCIYQYTMKCIVFFYSPFLCYKPKAYLCILFCVVAVICVCINKIKFIHEKRSLDTKTTKVRNN